jgi:1-acyl-sn-glycerol-3-phosphate acyltransferase
MFTLLAPLACLLIIFFPGKTSKRRIAKFSARTLLRLTRTPLVVNGLEHLPNSDPYIIVSNHASYLDSLVLTAALPAKYSFVAKKELLGQIFPRAILGALSTQYVERFDQKEGVQDVSRITEFVSRTNQSLIFFPEGTFVRQPGLRPFHIGAFKIAAELGIPVVPVVINGSRSILRDVQFFPRRGMLRLTVLRPVEPHGKAWADIISLRDKARAQILSRYSEPDLG